MSQVLRKLNKIHTSPHFSSEVWSHFIWQLYNFEYKQYQQEGMWNQPENWEFKYGLAMQSIFINPREL